MKRAAPAPARPVERERGFAYTVSGERQATQLDLAQAASQPPGTHFLWVHVHADDPECKAWLKDKSGLREALVEQLEAIETRPRAEHMEGGALINLRGVCGTGACNPADDLVSIRLWAERGRVISLSYHPIAAMPELRDAVEAGWVTDPGDLIAALVEATTDKLDPVAADLGDRLDTLEERLARRDRAIREPLAEVRLEAIELKRFLWPQKEAIARLASSPAPWLSTEDRGHIRSAADRVARMNEEIESVRERATVLSDQLFDLRAEDANRRSLVLSIVAAIFLPLTWFTGLFGMNVGGIPLADNPNGFWELTAITVLIGVALVGFFRLLRWL